MMIIKRSDVIGREIVDRVSGHRLGFASDLLIENLTRRVTGLLYNFANERWFLPRFFGKACEKLYEIFCNLILMLIVGCAHRRMGRPYTIGGATYRVCPDCGAYRLYDLEKMQFYGTYFYQFPAAGEAEQSYSIAGSLPLSGQIKQAA